MNDDDEGKVDGIYDLGGSQNLWVFRWSAPPEWKLLSPLGDGFILEVRRKSNNGLILSHGLKGTDIGGGITSISKLEVTVISS